MILPEHSLIWLVLLAALAALSSFFVYNEEGRTARKIILQFFLTIAAPTLALLGLPLLVLSYAVEIETALWQALIAGLVIATGWLTTAIFTELGKARTKAERMRDYHKAIYAEIGNTLASIWDQGHSEDYAAATLERMRQDAEFVPFIPREHHDHIYNAILREIDVLPRQTINAIVAYYSLIKAISALADDMRGDGFRGLAQDRRMLMYSDYSAMRSQAFAAGQFALRLILAFASGGPKEAETAAARFNTRGAGQSGQSQGSA